MFGPFFGSRLNILMAMPVCLIPSFAASHDRSATITVSVSKRLSGLAAKREGRPEVPFNQAVQAEICSLDGG